MRRLALVVIGLVLSLAPLLAAEDFTGKWSGTFIDSTNQNPDTILMDLKHKGTELTGTAGPNAERQWPILKGKVDGNNVTFEVQSVQSEGDGPLIKFTLTFVDGHLKGDAAAEFQGKKLAAKVDAQRKASF